MDRDASEALIGISTALSYLDSRRVLKLLDSAQLRYEYMLLSVANCFNIHSERNQLDQAAVTAPNSCRSQSMFDAW